MMPAYIQSFGIFECEKENSSSILTSQLKEAFQKPPRRIDNFIKLGLLGVNACLNGIKPEQCGIYLSSYKTDADAMEKILESIYVQKELPMPLSFIHSLSNSANYYIARHFQLDGSGVFLGACNQSLNQLFLLATIDLEFQQNTTALIGIIDEGPLQHTSIWFLLCKDNNDCRYKVSFLDSSSVLQQPVDNYLDNFKELYCYCKNPTKKPFISKSPGPKKLIVESVSKRAKA